ncbi:MAG: hypothetical protein JNK66_00980 [Chitinophagales bacterium]|nr:hypothetical protein [Chitinophagales bacterium]
MDSRQIDLLIDELFNYLQSIQNADGSFETLCLQPAHRPADGWFKYFGNSPHDTAVTCIPLLKMQHKKAKNILLKAGTFIRNESLDGLLWRYPSEGNFDLVPFDTDSTSLCSYLLEKLGYIIENKHFLVQQIDSTSYFPFYIFHKGIPPHLPIKTALKLWWFNRKAINSTNVTNRGLLLDDSEFCSTCVNLLYLGNEQATKPVWNRINTEFESMQIDFLYYIDIYRAFYFYSRLASYEKFSNCSFVESTILQYKKKLSASDWLERSPLNHLLLSIGLLLFKTDLPEELTTLCFHQILNKNYTLPQPLYSSNVKTDFDKNTNQPHSYFGSPAITTALYLEFLHLYKQLQKK